MGESVTGIPLQKMHHLSMDCPSVNLNVFDSLNTECNLFPYLINIGSCGHVVHGAFKTGVQSVKNLLERYLYLNQFFFRSLFEFLCYLGGCRRAFSSSKGSNCGSCNSTFSFTYSKQKTEKQ